MARTLIAVAVMILAAGTAAAQAAPTDVDAELRKLRAEAERMTELIDTLAKQGRVSDELEKKRAILAEHLSRFEALKAEVEAMREAAEKARARAIPLLERAMDASERADGGFLGVRIGDAAGPGVKIVDTIDGSPARVAGLAPGDVIVALDGQPVEGMSDVHEALKEKRAGTPVTLTITRGDAKLVRRLVLAPKPSSQPVVVQPEMPKTGYLAPVATPAMIQAKEKEIADLAAKLAAHRNSAQTSLAAGKYEAAAAAARAAAKVEAQRRKALEELAELKKRPRLPTIPAVRLPTPTIRWTPTDTTALEKKMDALAARLAALENRLVKIEKLLARLAER
jgi:C-terminal processing protease CtpA/Prc